MPAPARPRPTSDVRKLSRPAAVPLQRSGRWLRGTFAGGAVTALGLFRTQELQCRAARCGLDSADVNGPRDKFAEDLAEGAEAANEAERQEEVGDLLFSVVNY